jgi:hypothetical protein
VLTERPAAVEAEHNAGASPQPLSATQIVPICVICALALAAFIVGGAGKHDQTLEGLVIQDNSTYEFYPGLKNCPPQGTPYLLVPNPEFYDEVKTTIDLAELADLTHLERLLRGV